MVLIGHHIQQVVKNRKVSVYCNGIQAGPSEPQPGEVPWEIRPRPLDQGCGQCGSELLVYGGRLNLLQAAHIHGFQVKNLNKEVKKVLILWWRTADNSWAVKGHVWEKS